MEEIVVRAAALARRGEPLPFAFRVELDQVFAAVRPRVLAVARAMVVNPEISEEVAQDAIAEAWHKIAQFDGTGRFAAWVCEFARNYARNRRRKWTDVLTDDGDLDARSPEISVLAALTREERDRVLASARAQLPRAEQDVLYDYERGLSYAEIDALRGLKGTGARNELAKARRRLAGLLRTELDRLGHGSSFFRSSPG